jgi:hemerythrin-like domain-containing protein
MNPDKIKRDVEHGLDSAEIASPMNPPEPYELDNQPEIVYADLAKPLQILYDEHQAFEKVLNAFEKALIKFKEGQFVIDDSVSKGFRDFFEYMDQEILKHNTKEEKFFFPLLNERLIEAGECSPGLNPTTSIDIMEDDHRQVMQASCLIFNLLGIAAKLPDPKSQEIVFNNAFEQGREVVETMRLHIYKENNVLFSEAQKLITSEEFDVMYKGMIKIEGANFEV